MPPSSTPAQETPAKKLVELIKTLQFAWFIGHALTLFCTISYLATSQSVFYRVAYFGVIESFGIITYQHYFMKQAGSGASSLTPSALLQNGDVLYFAMALVWSFTPVFTLSIIPYALFSLFHVLIYLKSVLLPEVLGLNSSNSKVVSLIDSCVRDYNEKCMYWVGSTELGILVSLFLRVILWYPQSLILFCVYSLFIKLRFENSKYMKAAFAQWRVRLDGAVSHPSVPIPVKHLYGKFKSILIRVSEFRLTQAPVSTSSSQGSKTQ